MLRATTAAFALAGLTLAGCEGTLSFTSADPDGGNVVPPIGIDGGPSATDGGGRDSSIPIDEDSSVPVGVDAGPLPIRDSGPTDPCATISCGTGAHCEAGSCRCDDGYVDVGGSCVVAVPGDPATRTQAEVCQRWNEGHVENASPAWTDGATACDPGTLSPLAIEDTLRRIGMFRWLAGLPAVTHDDSDHAGMMECAKMMSANNALSHSPPATWNCYTAAGASAAGRSNIALGYGSPGDSIDGYMGDRNTMSLGHRRWLLGAPLGSVEIGYSGRGGCLGVFRGGGSTTRQWSAYPNEGFAPIATATDTWSFQAYGVGLTGSTSVRVVRVSDGMQMPVSHYLTGGGGPPPTLGWTRTGWNPAAGETYRVTIVGTSAGDITYDVKLVGC